MRHRECVESAWRRLAAICGERGWVAGKALGQEAQYAAWLTPVCRTRSPRSANEPRQVASGVVRRDWPGERNSHVDAGESCPACLAGCRKPSESEHRVCKFCSSLEKRKPMLSEIKATTCEIEEGLGSAAQLFKSFRSYRCPKCRFDRLWDPSINQSIAPCICGSWRFPRRVDNRNFQVTFK